MVDLPSYGALALRDELVEDEGCKTRVYTDPAGNLTIGVGHNLTSNGISQEAAFFILEQDIASTVNDLDRKLPWWRELPPPQQRVMINLAFNLGIVKFLRFPVFLGSMKRQDWNAAAGALQDSAWFHQVGFRGPRMVNRILATSPPIA